MRKIIGILLILSLAATQAAQAQLFFCGNYTDDGDPMGVSASWNLGPRGGYVYMLYSNKKKTIHAKTLSIVISKQVSGNFQPYDKRVMEVRDKKSWAVYDYHFTEQGTYKVSIEEGNGREIAKNMLFVALENVKQDNSPDKSYYNTNIDVCESIDENDAASHTQTKFYPGEKYIYIKNDRPLATDSIWVGLYKKSQETGKYDSFVDIKKYTIDSKSKYTYMKWTFTEPGEYAISVLNSKLASIGVHYVTVAGDGTPLESNDPDASYYNATTSFCENVMDGQPVKEGKTFKTGTVYVYVLNDKPLSTDSIFVDVQKKAYGTDNYNIFVKSSTFKIAGNYKGTFFAWDFEETGQFKVQVFNRRNQKISEGIVTIR